MLKNAHTGCSVFPYVGSQMLRNRVMSVEKWPSAETVPDVMNFGKLFTINKSCLLK